MFPILSTVTLYTEFSITLVFTGTDALFFPPALTLNTEKPVPGTLASTRRLRLPFESVTTCETTDFPSASVTLYESAISGKTMLVTALTGKASVL